MIGFQIIIFITISVTIFLKCEKYFKNLFSKKIYCRYCKYNKYITLCGQTDYLVYKYERNRQHKCVFYKPTKLNKLILFILTGGKRIV